MARNLARLHGNHGYERWIHGPYFECFLECVLEWILPRRNFPNSRYVCHLQSCLEFVHPISIGAPSFIALNYLVTTI